MSLRAKHAAKSPHRFLFENVFIAPTTLQWPDVFLVNRCFSTYEDFTTQEPSWSRLGHCIPQAFAQF